MKHTKILATYGPAIAKPTDIARLVKAGVNAFRVNCSHGDASDFRRAVEIIHQGSAKARFPVGILFDISGPKLRLDRFEGELKISQGDSLILTTGTSDLKARTVAVNHPEIIRSLRSGEQVFIDDGRYAFVVLSSDSKRAELKLKGAEAVVTSGKGINLPDTSLNIPTITEKDEHDIATAVSLGADFIALSFVRSGDDVVQARRMINKLGGRQRVIAKLEKREAIADLDNIMLVSNGVMIARGDLGVETKAEELPLLQKRIIALANQQYRMVIVATQMLESMRFSPRPTRAEVNDVASAVFDMADAVMLSAETATGEYPFETVTTMAATIEAAEAAAYKATISIDAPATIPPVPYAISDAVSQATVEVGAETVFAFTTSGFSAELISNRFPPCPVIALTPDATVMRQLSLIRSVYPIHIVQPDSFESMLETVDRVAQGHKLARPGDKVVLTGGAPFGSTAPTNFLMIHEIQRVVR